MTALPFPLTRREQLPEPGTGREDLRLDFKGIVDPADSFELAKDVAALANGAGGTIIVGAFEGANNTLGRYAPLPEDQASSIREAYNRAVRDRCAPPPVMDHALVKAPQGDGWLVVINVWPFTTQAVGVSVRDARGGPAENAWAFPFRTGTHSRFLRPEQLPMLMIPEIRRIASLLDAIPEQSRKRICVLHRGFGGSANTMRSNLELLELRTTDNVAIFQPSQQQPQGFVSLPGGERIHVPLDGIESVWSQDGGEWAMTLRGMIEVSFNKPRYSPR